MVSADLEVLAREIPSMSGNHVKACLRKVASRVPPGQSIVEVGSWLGGTAAQLCLGTKDSGHHAELHLYDAFQANLADALKATRQGTPLIDKMDPLPLVKRTLAPFKHHIVYHKGNTKNGCRYDGPLIGLYVDDASKTDPAWTVAVETFFPHFAEDVWVVLMDYYWYEKTGNPKHRIQQIFIDAHPEFGFVERIYHGKRKTSSAIFRRAACVC